MTQTITIPVSIQINGLWDDTGETELAIRLTMDDVALLRQTLPAFTQANARRDATTNPSNPSNPSDATCYDCSTNQTRLDTLVMLSDRVAAIEDRIAALESEPAQDETLLTVDIMAAYDLIARRERAAGGA